jgi:SAM-dependent methyltransferase
MQTAKHDHIMTRDFLFSIGLILIVLFAVISFFPFSHERVLSFGTDNFEAHYALFGERKRSQEIVMNERIIGIGAILVDLHRSSRLTPVHVTLRTQDNTVLAERVIPPAKIKDDNFAWITVSGMKEEIVQVEFSAPEATKETAIGLRFDSRNPWMLALAVSEKKPLWKYIQETMRSNEKFPAIVAGFTVALICAAMVAAAGLRSRGQAPAPAEFWDAKYEREEIACSPDQGREYMAHNIWKILKKYLKSKGRYLDAGCGVGGWMMFLKSQGYRVEGCDITPRTIIRIKQYDPALKVQVAGILKLPYLSQSLDGVLAIGVLEYVENKVPEAMAEVRRVLKPDGIFFIEVPILNALRFFIYAPLKQLEKGVRLLQGKQPVFAHYFFTRRELVRVLEQQGFRVVESAPHELPEPDRHYGLWNDWPFLRGKEPKQLNALGLFIKRVLNGISPWIAATGVLMVAKKRRGVLDEACGSGAV